MTAGFFTVAKSSRPVFLLYSATSIELYEEVGSFARVGNVASLAAAIVAAYAA